MHEAKPLHNKRPRPSDFETVAKGRNVVQLQQHYRAGSKAVLRWLAEIGAPVNTKAGKVRELPENIAELCEAHSVADVANLIGWSPKTLAIRLRTLHLDLYNKATANGKAKAIALAKRNTGQQKTTANVLPIAKLETKEVMEAADLARDFLRRDGPCYSARIVKPGMTGYYFRGIHYTAQALIAEAIKRGWSRNDWHGKAA